MNIRIRVDESTALSWIEIAHSVRMLGHCLGDVADPRPESAFRRVSDLYPYERISEWARTYLTAALEHLTFWADVHVPLKFASDQSVNVTLRPAYTLGRAALESAAQAVWLMDTADPMECIRRHISLIRWDLIELRKSRLSGDGKYDAKELEAQLVDRVKGVFDESEVQPPNGYLAVIRDACNADGLQVGPDDAERVWRAGSGAAHGKYWPTIDLQHVVQVETDGTEIGSAVVPDVAGMTEVLRVAHDMAQVGVLRYLDYCGLDISATLDASFRWYSEVVPLKDGISRESFRARWRSH